MKRRCNVRGCCPLFVHVKKISILTWSTHPSYTVMLLPLWGLIYFSVSHDSILLICVDKCRSPPPPAHEWKNHQEDTSSRMSRMRTQSMLRIESHRDAVLQALGASGSGTSTGGRAYNLSTISPSVWDTGSNQTLRVRGLDGSTIDSSGRPRSAGGRLTSISHMLEGLSKSPLLSQVGWRGFGGGAGCEWWLDFIFGNKGFTSRKFRNNFEVGL